jgi:hypothetical protein
MADVAWSIRGAHFANCNCDFGCPCQFNALPTSRTCRALLAWTIEEGHFGSVGLDGLNAVVTYAWPGAVHQGNGAMQSIIDERASADQRKALVALMQGEGATPGVTMLQIYRSMCTTVHDPLFGAISLTMDVGKRTARLSIPGLVETTVEPIKNPVTGAEHRARIELPSGLEFNMAEVASGTTKASGAVKLEFAKSHAHLVYNTMTATGIRS